MKTGKHLIQISNDSKEETKSEASSGCRTKSSSLHSTHSVHVADHTTAPSPLKPGFVPSAVEENRDQNNRTFLHLGEACDDISELANLKFPEFISKDKIM